MKPRWPQLVGAQLVLTTVVFFGFLFAVGEAAAVPRMLAESETWLTLLGLFATVSLVQIVLLAPVVRRRPRRERGVSVWASLGLGAALFALVLGTLVMSVGQALFDESGVSETTALAAASVTAAAWIGGTVYFAAYMRARPGASREGLVHLLARRLLQASIFEVVASIPLDAMIRRKTSCHCSDASVLAFAVSMGVGVVVFGPAVLLSLLRKDRASWYRERCDACGTKVSDANAGSYREPPTKVCASCGHAVAMRPAP